MENTVADKEVDPQDRLRLRPPTSDGIDAPQAISLIRIPVPSARDPFNSILSG